MALFHVLIALIILVLIIYGILIYVQQSNPLRLAPGEPLKLLFGKAVQNHHDKNYRCFDYCEKQRQKYGTIRKISFPLGNIGLYVSDPEWIKYILITNGANFASGLFLGSGFFKQAVGDNGLVVVNGETHKRYKKILSPAYKLSTLKKSMPIVHTCSERMVNLFNDYCRRHMITSGNFAGSAEVDVKYLFNKTTLDIAVLFILGYDLQESCTWKKETYGHYLWEVLEMQDHCISKLSVFYAQPAVLRFIRNMMRKLPGGGMYIAETTNRMHDIISDVIKASVDNVRRKYQQNNDPDSFKSLLEYMLDEDNDVKLSQQEIHDIVMTFIIGGHETASISLTFTLLELCKHPDIQTRCREEVVRVFKEHNDKIDWVDIDKKFPFLNAVVKESLRLYPPVPWLPRNTVKPDIIDGHYVPANTIVTVMTFEMHHNPDIWADPFEFKPERFLEPEDTIPWDSWLPFGDGMHKCIGYQFGLIEVAYLLAIMLKNFRFTHDPKIDYREFLFVSLNTDPGIKIYISPL